MPKTIWNRSKLNRTFRNKTVLVAAGLGTSVALGAGVAMAADTGAKDGLYAADTASQVAESTRGQADSLTKAEEAKKIAKDREADAKKKAARDAERKAKSWTKPVHDKYELTADFGNSGDRWSQKHSGQDFGVPVGTDVDSVHGGTVVKAGPNGAGDGASYGNAIVIKHGNGSYSQYAHLSEVDVKPGQQVETGQKIAKSGNTGNSSGPHLHFEIRTGADYGTAIEPQKAMDKVDVKF